MSTNNHLEWLTIVPHVHYVDCWKEHHECALVEIKRLQEQVQLLQSVLEEYDIAVFDDNVFRVTKKK